MKTDLVNITSYGKIYQENIKNLEGYIFEKFFPQRNYAV